MYICVHLCGRELDRVPALFHLSHVFYLVLTYLYIYPFPISTPSPQRHGDHFLRCFTLLIYPCYRPHLFQVFCTRVMPRHQSIALRLYQYPATLVRSSMVFSFVSLYSPTKNHINDHIPSLTSNTPTHLSNPFQWYFYPVCVGFLKNW
ncbi:hypothetical protein P9112_005216 [Eukaryota sp. TZLM1-RC]